MKLTRRDFIRTAAVIGAGVVVAPGLVEDAFAAKEGPLVVMAKGTKPGRLAREAVAALGGMSAFVKRGETVVVKPNIGWDRAPEYAGNTHPDVVAEVVLMCLEAGAAKVKVFDRTCNDPRRCYTNSGISPALERLKDKRVLVSHIDDRRFREVKIPGGRHLTAWEIYDDVLKADRFINVPIAKHHSASELTIGMKNVMGVIGGNRAVLHKNIHQALADLNLIIKSDLTIVDAFRVLVANGPQGGDLDDVRKLDAIVASSDVVAADTVAATLFGKTPNEVQYLRLAQDAGVGVCDMGRIKIVKAGVRG